MRFMRGWWGCDLGSHRQVAELDDDTYGSLPLLPAHIFDGRFGWLTPQAAGADAQYMEANPVPTAGLARIDRRLARDGLALPSSFVTFMGSETLQRAVPHVATCWEMSPTPVPSPVEKHAYLVRFMHDVQSCAYWYLYLGSDGSSPVVASINLYEPTESEEDEDMSTADFLDQTVWLAPDFEHFVYRYWIESVACCQADQSGVRWDDLRPEVREYLDHYRHTVRAQLDVWPSAFPAAALRNADAMPGQAALW
ncbi:hypothetical protein [Micromonospora sp. bgisy143]|uniref:hypothetical protein n=1 Tax=Micromonospora sp. bgisy143 TaxID=3413790 RepID=UPI003EBBDD44